ncbi:MAG TPA: hypothetical protein VI548_14100 [Chitinophagaceae bacterium]|nr:hypothetical protein [Chitinophagaceae bacterium]
MKFEYKHLLPENFSPESRVWIYQCNRVFTLSEALEVESLLNNFSASWLSHGSPVKGAGFLFFGQFIILMADEKATGVSGCSTDSSARLIKDIEQKFAVNMFDRNTLAFVVKEKVQLLPLTQLPYAFENDFINGDTLYFNNLVQTKEELGKNWMLPLRQSWLKSRLKLNAE